MCKGGKYFISNLKSQQLPERKKKGFILKPTDLLLRLWITLRQVAVVKPFEPKVKGYSWSCIHKWPQPRPWVFWRCSIFTVNGDICCVLTTKLFSQYITHKPFIHLNKWINFHLFIQSINIYWTPFYALEISQWIEIIPALKEPTSW